MYINLDPRVEVFLQHVADYCGTTPEELVEEMVEGAVFRWIAAQRDTVSDQDIPQVMQ